MSVEEMRAELLGMLELDEQLDDWAIPDARPQHSPASSAAPPAPQRRNPMTEELVHFINSQLEDELAAADLIEGVGLDNLLPGAIITPDGATEFSTAGAYRILQRVLSPEQIRAQVAAKRRILNRWRPAGADPHPGVPCENWPGQGAEFRDPHDSCVHHLNAPARIPDEVVQILALPYADRPGYLKEWKP